MEKVSITTSLLNTIVQYLANRPYIEVAGMIERVQTELKQNARTKPSRSLERRQDPVKTLRGLNGWICRF
jgi:hypothetical protein